jgi:elongation factor P--(R)-beta-lysine ligase
MPMGAAHGRISFVDDQDLILEDQIKFQTANLKFIESTDLNLAQVLGAGDLVAIKEKQLILLSPMLSQSEYKLNAKPEILQYWSDYLFALRLFFSKREFVEASTPTLVPCPGTEPYLEVFQAEFKMGRQTQKLFMTTSPELHLKKMLASGVDKVFEIKNCFRNGEISEHHEPEFLMLEWYRAFSDLNAIKEDVFALISTFDPDIKVEVQSMAHLFKIYAGAEINPNMNREDWFKLAQNLSIRVLADDTIDEIFHRLFLEKIEQQLPKDTFTIVTDYPPFQAAYARLNNAGWADRFEVYSAGLEIANAFHELNDPVEQKKRMQADLDLKTKLGLTEIQLDQDFIRALESGMPPSGGIALGVERLFMALLHIKQIQDVKPFSYKSYLQENRGN